VLGANGVLYTPFGGDQTRYFPPTAIQLCDKDLFQVRKKIFRFEYGAPESMTANDIPESPMVAKARRRSSLKMSLVPRDKTFESQMAMHRKEKGMVASGLRQENTFEEEEAELQDNDLVLDVVEGEGGDLVYLELTEDVVESGRVS
jgi:hypothetical protein